MAPSKASDEIPVLLRSLRRALGDVPTILRLVQQAEDILQGDYKGLCNLYQVAQHAFGMTPLQASPEGYGELSVKRLEVLKHVDPEEAKVFYRFLAKYNIRQQDERVLRLGLELGVGSSNSASMPPPPVPAPRPQHVSTQVLDPPPATAKAASRTSSTPIRPRSLRYSGCSEDAGGLTGFLDGPCSDAAAEDQNADAEGPATVEFTRVSGLDGLSPILECESPRDLAQLNDFSVLRAAEARPSQGLPSTAKAAAPQELLATGHSFSMRPMAPPEHLSLEAQTGADGKALKTIVVNGVPYTKLEIVGRGGTSKVYKVLSPEGETYALKRAVASCMEHFEALANEVTLLQQLKGSPHIIQVCRAEVLPQELVINIVMEIGDMDLSRLLQSDPDLGLADLQKLWREMLEAVQVVHDAKIVHSDLKPANFLRVGNRLKLIDFGIAKKIASNTNNISRETSVGTVSYMAPEAAQAAHHRGPFKFGRPSDVWSLGVILYQMVYRRCPFSHYDPMTRVAALTDPKVLVHFPPDQDGCLFNNCESTRAELRDVLERCLQRESRKRPTIPEMLEHPFVSAKSITIDRSSCQALVRSFLLAAKDSILQGDEASAADEGMADCQLVADEVWQSISRKRSLPATAEDFSEAVAPFRECVDRWLLESKAKRQRPTAVPEVKIHSLQENQQASGVRAVSSSAPAQEMQPFRSMATAAPVRSSSEVQPARQPLATISENRGRLAAAAICSEMLQQKRNCLRKPAPTLSGKENVAVGPASLGQPENMVLRRLKDRRALVDEGMEEELTQITRWGVAG